MSRAAARKASKRALKLVSNKDNRRLREADLLEIAKQEQEARMEHQQNRRRFVDLKPRNKNQALYMQYLEESRLVYATGSAGTGKTLVATIWACKQLEEGKIERIIVTRPMVGCDEDMGFLPGTEGEKYIGWVGPVMEILEGYFGKKQVETFIKFNQIILKPLMMMRGSTFRNAVAILDEAQNTTPGQMKMFLTRVGENTKLIINGDLEQSDLPPGRPNGLADSVNRLKNSRHVRVVEFSENDIVRDALVRDIIKAYRTK